MKTGISVFVAVNLLLTIVSFPLEAFAHGADTSSFRGETVVAVAVFSSVDEAGMQTDVFIVAEDSKGRSAPDPVIDPSSGLELHIFRFDSACPPSIGGCPAHTMIGRAFVRPLADKDFQAPAISPGSSARLSTTVSVFDQVANSFFDVLIDLTWVCIGEVDRSNYPRHFVLPGISVEIESVQNTGFCSAEASGSISDGLTNFTPEPSLSSYSGWDTLMFQQASVQVVISIEP